MTFQSPVRQIDTRKGPRCSCVRSHGEAPSAEEQLPNRKFKKVPKRVRKKIDWCPNGQFSCPNGHFWCPNGHFIESVKECPNGQIPLQLFACQTSAFRPICLFRNARKMLEKLMYAYVLKHPNFQIIHQLLKIAYAFQTNTSILLRNNKLAISVYLLSQHYKKLRQWLPLILTLRTTIGNNEQYVPAVYQPLVISLQQPNFG